MLLLTLFNGINLFLQLHKSI